MPLTADERWARSRAWLAGFKTAQKMALDFTAAEMEKALDVFLAREEFPNEPKEATNGRDGDR